MLLLLVLPLQLLGGSVTWHPANEGVDHVNAYSRSRLEIGRDLSNFADAPFECADGRFRSLEGYWYWISVPAENSRRETLRAAFGHGAKQLGRELRRGVRLDTPDFRERIVAAFDAKLGQNPQICTRWAPYGHLPVVHYYGSGGRVVEPEGSAWLWDHVNAVRVRLFRSTLAW